MWLAVLVFICMLGILAYLDAKKPPNYPPGPPWLPILGSIVAVYKLRKKTGYLYEATAELARQYGPVVGLKTGKDRLVVLYEYEAMKEMLLKEEFEGRPHGVFYETRTWGKRRGVLLTDEEFWIEQRRFVLRQLKEFGFGRRTMAELVEGESVSIVDMLKQKVGKAGAVVTVNDLFSVYILNTLWSMMAGIRYSPQDTELKSLQKMLTELFANIDMVGSLFSQFPILRFLAPEISGYTQFVNIHKKLWRFLQDELEKHKSTIKADDSRDFMDVYLKVVMSNGNKKNSSFTESQLLAICMDLFMAGSETTTKSLQFGFLYMLLYPEVQTRAQAEIERVVGKTRLPLLSDRPNMPYVESIVLESLRMFMGRTFSIPHRTLKDTKLQGYDIPKDTMVICNFNGNLMSKKLWGDPDIFRPERFINGKGQVFIPEYYTPFGMGKHRCMGETLAKANIFLFTASLLQNFTFSVPPGTPPPTTLCVDGVTPAPKPFSALVTPRTYPICESQS